MMNSKNKTLSADLARALSEIEEMADSGVKFVPERPSRAMTQAGALAGGIDEAKAAKIYRAMLEAEALEDAELAVKARPNQASRPEIQPLPNDRIGPIDDRPARQ